MRPLLTQVAAAKIYQAYIIPLITYCSLTNYNIVRSKKEATSTFEQRAVKIIGSKCIPLTETFLKKKTCEIVKKCLNGDFPFFMEYFEYVSHEYYTRNNNKLLRLPKIKLESSKKSFFYNGAKVYNSLPTYIRDIEDTDEFLKVLEKFSSN